jgi:hypothetical protein
MIKLQVDEVESAARRIAELIAAHGEWLYAEGGGRPFALRRDECDARVAHGRLIFSCWSERGSQAWRVTGWEWTGEKLLLEATRRTGAESRVLELIPRAAASAIAAILSATRRKRCERLAQLACAQAQEQDKGAKIERVGLSAGVRRGQPGSYARILLRLTKNQRLAVTGPINGSDPRHRDARERDAFLSSSLLWFTRLCERARAGVIRELWLIVEPKLARPMAQQLALLRDDLRHTIKLYVRDEHWQALTPAPLLEREELWTRSSPRLRSPATEIRPSDWARRLLALSPAEIDVVHARHGETLRFHGLAFARVRRTPGGERAWLGVEGRRRRLLDESNWDDCVELLQQLKEHRSATASDHRHALYRAAPEAWLESLLRRDVSRLDPGLRLAPLYTQFRTARDHGAGRRPVDLLALRRDGRLAVIELKVAADREHVLQAVDYWRRIEALRRDGQLARARLFGAATIANQPPLVYLVAPLLHFHRAFQPLARSISHAIRIYRFDLNEDWRAGVRVMRRCSLTPFLMSN